jgi:tetratricopeptide (TPR) repeat protein
MATRKRVKKNIKEDQLVTYAVTLSRWTQEHFNQVVIGVVVLVAVIAIAVFTANSRQGSSRQAELQLASAMSLMQTGDLESARSSFGQIDDRYGGKSGAKARFYRAECELRMGRFAEALASYQAYVDEQSEYPVFRESAVIGQALCHEGLGNFSEAANTMVSLLETLDEDDPRYLDSAYQAGEFFAKAGDTERAAEYFVEVKEKASGNLKDKASVAAALLGR